MASGPFESPKTLFHWFRVVDPVCRGGTSCPWTSHSTGLCTVSGHGGQVTRTHVAPTYDVMAPFFGDVGWGWDLVGLKRRGWTSGGWGGCLTGVGGTSDV